MSDLSTDARLRKLVAEHLGVDIAKATDDADLLDDLGADSLDVVELTIAVEDEFRLEKSIPDEQADKWRTVGDMLRTVEGLL